MSISQIAYCLVSLLRKVHWGGKKKYFKDTLKASLKDFFIYPDVWENMALDRASWQNALHCGAASNKSQ